MLSRHLPRLSGRDRTTSTTRTCPVPSTYEAGRSDDTEAVIRHRLELYHEQTEAVMAKYAERGILTQVDGTGPVDQCEQIC